ncbi:putative sensor histidine kinase/response regulator [Aspergillus thermomutatus]|uniref:Histidine kinase n=1 Tax=Aspergillus thermomutatus TaxID=41047 RepID=A0A397HPW0_ASPTH|nr:uncharacterized protein CDV56_108948 [Aspergillus thermomutatus]RHZ63626.1 hypothetical protein CDV56_108948 [Aspergillus thermomutatus]
MPSHSVSAQELADMLPTGVAMLNHRDEAIFTNRRFRALMTSCNPRSFDCWSQSIHPDDYDRLATAYHDASRAQQPLRIEYRTRDDDCPWRLLTLTPMAPDERARFGLGSDGGSICTIADISQEKTAELSHKKIAEEAQQRKTQQERFIDMISHEVRNPLSAILHCTEDILEAVQRAGDAETTHAIIAQAAETISLCVAHQKKIVDDVLTFSKVDAGMLALTPRRVQPRRHLATSLTMFRPELRKEHIEFEYKLDHSYEEQGIDWVMADLDRMSQVLINLVSNAIKFTAKSGGEMKVRVSMGASTTRPPSYPPNVVFFSSDETALGLDRTRQAEWGEGPTAYIMVAVRDTGIGISDEAQKRLFERFNQATPRTESIYGGSGLGLNVSRRLCHLHGGEIGVSSKEGEGSTFGFFFAVRKSDSVGETSTSHRVQIDQKCLDIQSLGEEITNGNHQMTSPPIPQNPEVTYIEEINPACSSDGRKDHTAKLAEETGVSPTADTPENSPTETRPNQENDSKSDGHHILLVEDNIINQRILSRKLQCLGFSVTEASHGREALDAVKNDHFDCILMDQAMPVMDGNSATKAIRELEKEEMAGYTPVLGVTANVRAEQQEEMLQSGMDDVIHKPYRMCELTEKIEQLIQKESAHNEHLRLAERYLPFDIPALMNVIAAASGHATSDIVSFYKMAEGGFNRLFQATFTDGKHVVARLPYPSTAPEHYTVASEAATLDYLRLHGIPTPGVYAWCSTKANPVGAEYILMEKLDGTPLGDIWYAMTPKEQHKIMKQIVEWETRLMSLEFPACGSLYYQKDLPTQRKVPLPNHNGSSSSDLFRAVSERELTWAKAYAKPRLPYERLYREIYGFCQISPDRHIQNLSDYLTLAPCLGFKAASSLNRPVIRHPDLQPNNILISDANEVVGFVDWQHCTILPLGLAAGIPKDFQNYGDPDSEKLIEPRIDLPPNYDSLPESAQLSIRETIRKRLVHFLYAAFTRRLNEEHYDAIFDQSAILHQRLFKSAGSPWEGDSITLRADMIRALQSWPNLISADSVGRERGTCNTPSLTYSDRVVRDTLALDARQKEADLAMDQMRNVLGVDILGWVPSDEYEAAKELAREIKAKMLKAAETNEDRIGIQNHFPFDDFDENS